MSWPRAGTPGAVARGPSLGAVALGLLLAGCPAQESGRSSSTLTRALLDLARESEAAGRPEDAADPLPDETRTWRELARIAEQARRLQRSHSGDAVERLNETVFARERFQPDPRDASLRSALLPRVLARRRGSCLGLGGLFLALAEELRLPLAGVLLPGHFALHDARGQRYLELLERGRVRPRDWYVERYRVPAGNSLYLRPLAVREVLAVFRFNLANEHRARGSYAVARTHYARVVAELPGFAEAQLNLGLTLERLGERAAAREALRRAAAANPGLGGQNASPTPSPTRSLAAE